MNYAKLAFSETIKKIQEEKGSRSSYERMEVISDKEGLGSREIQMIQERDSFYLASQGENGFPYIQHRGGPKGFLKVLDPSRLAFLDFSGNMQFITVGNMDKNNKVSLILVDYPNRTRLKIFAEARIVSMDDQPELAKELDLGDYQHRAERIILLQIKAFDWNCPQHITPRYTLDGISEMIASRDEYIKTLEKELNKR